MRHESSCTRVATRRTNAGECETSTMPNGSRLCSSSMARQISAWETASIMAVTSSAST